VTLRFSVFKGSILHKPGFWLIIALFVLISVPYYQEALPHPAFITRMLLDVGLTRHAFERVLYLVPVICAGFWFGWRGSVISSLAALALMLPRALWLSDYRTDAIFETTSVFLLGSILSLSFRGFQREKEYRIQLENAFQKMKTSEERYRQLFDNAFDAIFIHDADGNINAVNKACTVLTGYETEDLLHMQMSELLSEESWLITGALEQLLLGGEDASTIIEAVLIKKDGSRSFIHLSLESVRGAGSPVNFQCTARDISEQKRMQENLRHYLRQATRAQEEERKRVALELHDETIQELVVLSRQIDVLTSKCRELTPENSLLLQGLKQNAGNAIQSLRHISQDLRPATLDRLGLLASLGFLASEATKNWGIAARATVKGTESRLPEEVEVTLFRIAQEALRNIWKHAGAKTAEIKLEFDAQETRLTITDDGKGFDLRNAAGDIAEEGKLGVVGMRERARLIGSRFEIDSEPGKGTVVTIEVPRGQEY
jgi:PAS domain S-box-containing protein